MAGNLILVNSVSVSSSTATVTLTGIDSTYDVYKVVADNIRPDVADLLQIRVTKGGSPQTDSEYDGAYIQMYTGGSYVNESFQNQDRWKVPSNFEETTATGRGNGSIMYLFNFADASEYSFMTLEQAFLHSSGALGGNQGSAVHTVASASDGVNFYFYSSNNFEQGEFKLYGLKK